MRARNENVMSSVMKGKCLHTRSQCCHRKSVREFRLPLERAVGASRPRRAAELASGRGAKASPGLGILPLAHRVAHLVAREQRFPSGNFLTYKSVSHFALSSFT